MNKKYEVQRYEDFETIMPEITRVNAPNFFSMIFPSKQAQIYKQMWLQAYEYDAKAKLAYFKEQRDAQLELDLDLINDKINSKNRKRMQKLARLTHDTMMEREAELQKVIENSSFDEKTKDELLKIIGDKYIEIIKGFI